MVQVSTKEARATLGELIGRARFAGERIVITSRGRPACAVISVEDLKQLEDAKGAPAIAPKEEP